MRLKLDFQLCLLDDPASLEKLAQIKAGDALVLRELIEHPEPDGRNDSREEGQIESDHPQASSSHSHRNRSSSAVLAVDLASGMHVGSVPPHAVKKIQPWLSSMHATVQSSEEGPPLQTKLPYKLTVRSMKKSRMHHKGEAESGENQSDGIFVAQQVLLRIEEATAADNDDSRAGTLFDMTCKYDILSGVIDVSLFLRLNAISPALRVIHGVSCV